MAGGVTDVEPAIRSVRRGRTAGWPSLVFLSPSGQVGGAERVLLDLVAGLRAARPEQALAVISSADGPLIPALRDAGATVTVLKFPVVLAGLGDAAAHHGGRNTALLARAALAAPDVMRYAAALRAELRRLAPAVIHSNGAKMHVLAAGAGAGIAPVVWHLHEYPGARPVMRWALRACRTRASAIIANSASVADDACRVLGRHAPVHTVRNAVDTERFQPTGATLDLDALGGLAPEGTPVVRIGLIATHAIWKGHSLFFQALGQLASVPGWRAAVVGGPLYETQGSQHTGLALRQMAAEAGIAERVAFTGHVADVPAAIRALDIVVHASTSPEPFGLVIAEAMACGRPVVTAGTGGAVEVAQVGDGAMIVPPNDATALADAIRTLIADAARREMMGRSGRRTAIGTFGRDRFVSEVAAVHAAVAGRQVR